MTQEEINKQIEAVRGLIKGHNGLLEQAKRQASVFCSKKEMEENTRLLNLIADSIHSATETLKPYLNGEKLEV